MIYAYFIALCYVTWDLRVQISAIFNEKLNVNVYMRLYSKSTPIIKFLIVGIYN